MVKIILRSKRRNYHVNDVDSKRNYASHVLSVRFVALLVMCLLTRSTHAFYQLS